MAGERDVLAEANSEAFKHFGVHPWWPPTGDFTGFVLAALTARGYTLSRSGAPWDWDEATMAAHEMAGERLYPEPEAVFELAALIRKVDGNHDLGATVLAEAIVRGGYTLSRSEPDGLPPGMRLVSGPVGTCEWTAHHWTADRWGQTICLACNARIEPIPAAPAAEPLPLDVETP